MLSCQHLVLSASDLKESKKFYIDKLGFEIIEENENLFAFRAGDIRVSVFPGGNKLDLDKDKAPNIKQVYRVDNIEFAVEDLKKRNVEFLGEITEAPGFMKHIPLVDPDNNLIFIGQYYSDPLKPHSNG